MSRSRSSKTWLREHFSDPFVKAAQTEGYRSRAAYKLLALQAKDHFLKSGSIVIDLGAAPGGWSQVAAKIVSARGKVIASDTLPMTEIVNVQFIQGDFREESIFTQIKSALGASEKANVVLSDMAPNMSGIASSDQARAMYLAELALALAEQLLTEDGCFVVKVFQGEGFDQYLQAIKQLFKTVHIRKPEASRARSAEIYLVAKQRKFAIDK